MRADQVHGKIGIQMRKSQNIFNFQDFVKLCNDVAGAIRPVCLELGDFYHFLDGHRIRSTKRIQIPHLKDFVEVESKKSSNSLFYKVNLPRKKAHK